MHKMVRLFRNKNRENHHIESIIQKIQMARFLKKNGISFDKKLTIYDTTGFNISANIEEYKSAGINVFELYCCEIDKKLKKSMQNKKYRDNLKNTHITYNDIFKAVRKSKSKVRHINFDGTKSLATLIKNGLFNNIEELFKMNSMPRIFTFALLFDLNSSIRLMNKKQFGILNYLNQKIKEVTNKYNRISEFLYNNSYRDGYKRVMQSAVFGFR